MAITVNVTMLSGGPRFDYDNTGMDFTYAGNVKVFLLSVNGIPTKGYKVIAGYAPYNDISTSPTTIVDNQTQCKSAYDKLGQKDNVGSITNTIVPRGSTIQVLLMAVMLDGTIGTSNVLSITTDAPVILPPNNPYVPIKVRP